MTSSSTEFYEWLIRVTALIRAQKEPREQELFEIFVKELGQVFQFDHLAMKKQLIHNLPLILLAAAPALAEQPIKAEIPFSFHLGGSVLPAGSYTVDGSVAHEALRFRSADGKSSVMILSHAVQSAASPIRPKLVFNRYGEQYFLSQVWAGESNTGHELLKSHLEKKVAAATRTTAPLQATN